MRDTANLMGLPNENENFTSTACGAEPTGGCSFTILRFVADNPGAWFFHCHIGTRRPPSAVIPRGAGLRRARGPPGASGAAPPDAPALRKPNGRVRGIATGDNLRRLVARTLAQIHAEELEHATAPF